MDRGCRQEEALIGYLYNECEPEEHARLEAHLATCAQELESLRSVCGPPGGVDAPRSRPSDSGSFPTGTPGACRGGGGLCSRRGV